METTIFGWTVKQTGYAKQRYNAQGESAIPANMEGLLQLKSWWESSEWPDPLEILFENVVLEFDRSWAATAFKTANESMCPK